MPIHDTSYKHWEGIHLGIWHRRMVVASNGLTACLRNNWTRNLVVMCWFLGLLMAGVLFTVGQLLVHDSLVVDWVGNLNGELQKFAQMLTTWLEEHPQISVYTTQNLLFYFFCIYLMVTSIFVLGMTMPLLITRDLASNSIIIYSSKAISLGDYLLGKFCTAFGMLIFTWLGPVLLAWFLGNMLAPSWTFFWHSRAVLAHLLMFGLCAMTFLSLLALGISALSTKEKSTTALWYAWWLVGGVGTSIAAQTKPWLQHLSFNYNLDQLALVIFHPGADIKVARESIPVLGLLMANVREETLKVLDAPAIWGALAGIVVMIGFVGYVIKTKVKPE